MPTSSIATILLTFAATPLLAQSAPPEPTARPAAASDDPRRPGTKRMAELLEEVAKNADPEEARFLSRERVPLFQKKVERALGKAREPELRVKLATEIMQAGEPTDSLAEFDRAEQAYIEQHGKLDPAFARELDRGRAIAWIRQGEQDNCLKHHCCQSCIMPIDLGGQHSARSGSEHAIELFKKLCDSDPNDLESRWLLNLAHMTLGTWPDKVPPGLLLKPELFASEHSFPRWADVAPQSGLVSATISGGAVTEDLDGDGFIDVLLSSIGLRDRMHYFHANGDGTFTDRTHEAGLDGIVGGLNMIHGDFDNDGHPDVYVLRGAWLGEQGRIPGSLLKNMGDGTFEDVTLAAGLCSPHPTQTGQFADFDGDGWLDLVIGKETQDQEHKHPCELWWNQRDGTFKNVAAEVGVATSLWVKGVAVGDIDDDGRPDLYYSIRNGMNQLFRNEAVPSDEGGSLPFRFRDVTAQAGVAQPRMSFPTWFFDYDNDGRQDLFAASNSGFADNNYDDICALYLGRPIKSELPHLYHNEGNGRFKDVSHETRVDRALLSMGSNFGDLDNDGWLDFYLGNGAPDFGALLPDRMFRNDGGKRFQDVTTAGGFGHIQKGHAVAFADLDNDGDQDVFLEVGGFFTGDVYPCVLFENPGNANHWLTLRLRGVKANRSAIGARIRVDLKTPAGPRSLHLVCNTGGSFGSSSLQQEIGLGDATAVERVVIRWPGSGTVSDFAVPAIDRVYSAVEGEPALTEVSVKRIKLGGGEPPAAADAAVHGN